jgi:hypothetical protein
MIWGLIAGAVRGLIEIVTIVCEELHYQGVCSVLSFSKGLRLINNLI